ncbi:transcriptional regulator, LysR family (plasmid) [Rhizobium favelukesii]|uniref:Transcriptional regulator, LysR family n=1 Tax=Rhizobium favelukesii TaxID=348824 RepID=W6RPB0_9HYPH|nr:transcriptional regulator, LysR family [Rhizobium favelukesii]
MVSAGLGIGFAPEWAEGLPNRAFELKAVRCIDFGIGLAVAWNKKIARRHRRLRGNGTGRAGDDDLVDWSIPVSPYRIARAGTKVGDYAKQPQSASPW